MNPLTLLRVKNKVVGNLMPSKTAKQYAKLFLTARHQPSKAWEQEVEQQAQRMWFGDGLSALYFKGQPGAQKILLMHGWESRATHMAVLAKALVHSGCEVVAIDAPMHGQSLKPEGRETWYGAPYSHPIAFAAAVAEAHKAFGPFDGAVGHSMGCIGLAVARSEGVDLGRYCFIASPVCIDDTLQQFAQFMGLPERCAQGLADAVAGLAKRPPSTLHGATLMAGHGGDIGLVHAKDDVEVPYTAMLTLRDLLPNATIMPVAEGGHRRIIRSARVVSDVAQFMVHGGLRRSPGNVQPDVSAAVAK